MASRWGWRSSTSSPSAPSLKLFLFMIPLILVIGFVSVQCPKTSNLVAVVSYHPSLLTSTFLHSPPPFPPPPSSSSTATLTPDVMQMSVSPVENSTERRVDLGARASADSVVNSSLLPALAQETVEIQQAAMDLKEEPQQNVSTAGPHVASSSTNESKTAVSKTRARTEYSKLGRLEAGLGRARALIRSAKEGNQTRDRDYVPVGPMYWNAKTFHRSYLEMEKQFKVFIYEEGEPPVFHNGPCKSIYSMEGTFIHKMEINSQFRTSDPTKAHVYFLPFSVTMLVRFVYVRDSHDFHPIKQTVRDYVNIISTKYPYWNRSHGADHFMLACHDWGPETSSSVPYLLKNSIRVLCNANTSEGFNPAKDVSFPEINLQTGGTNGLIGGPSPSKRPVLAFFAGGLHGPIRPVLLEHWENRDEDVRVHRYLPKGVSYYDMMRKSKYCICPSGYEVASPRVVEALYTGCVPVLISDHYVPPFSDVLNWKSFSVEVSVKDIPNLKKILTGISSRRYIRLQRRGMVVRKHFEVNPQPKRFDVFHMILHSIWLRRLNVRVHEES